MISGEPDHNLAEEVFIFPASFAQQRLWFIEQLVPEASLYTIPLVFRLTGSLHRSALEQSIQAIAGRHESLRTTFDVVNGQLVQVIAPVAQVSLPFINLQALPTTTPEDVALEQIRQEIQQPFNLNQGPLFKVRLWRLDATEHLLLILLHHIIFDEWSSGVLIRELGELYTAFVDNQPAALNELPIQYADFAHWQREWLQGEVLNGQLSYWRQQLKDVSVLNLSTSSSRPLVQSYQGASQLLELPQRLLDALEALSQQAGTTLFMTLLAAFQTLLHRYTGQTDSAIGSPIANRHRSELEGLIGFLVNSLVLRTDLSGDPTFRELLDRVRDVTLTAYAHQDLPFEKLVEELQPVRSFGQNPLFQVVFALQNTPMEQLELPGLTLSPLEFETKTTRFDLELYVWKCAGNFRSLWGKGWQQSDGLRGVIVYNTDLFDADAIASFRHHFQTLLEGIVANPDARLSALPLLTAGEQQQVLINWSRTQTDYPANLCIHQLFEEQVKQQPNAPAVKFAKQQFTYRELNQGSNQLARYLQMLGIDAGMRVGICLEQTAETIAAMLAVLKAGAAYVPLDPGYPPERLQFLLEDAQVSVLLTQQAWADSFKTDTTRIICLEQEWSAIAQESEENLVTPCTADQLAYVIYTSGSTGTPKGVMVPHRAVNRLVCQTNYVQIEPDNRVAQVANLAFDAATFEIWGALLNGAQLIGIGRETTLSPGDFVAELQHQQISVMFLTTALFNQTVSQIPDAFRSLKYLLFGGEAANPDRVRAVLQQGKPQHLIHVYGPTENTTFSTWYEVQDVPVNATTIAIGRAIANTQVYVLDANLNPVPAGVNGEIYLGGDGLARGYLNRSELTAERFISNPFFENDEWEVGNKKSFSILNSLLSIPYSRLYKTGDRARYRRDGNLEFLGRTDHQIKIRGFRVELGEIEAVLIQHPTVQAATVTVRAIAADQQLIAYVVPTSSTAPTERDLRCFLKTKLPVYMLPAAFVMLDALPLTSNGKVDQRALPPPNLTIERTIPTVAPTTSLEKALVELWSQLLGHDHVGIHDNFFELGGHSLLATQLISRMRDRFQVEIQLRSLFETPTIAELAQQLEAGWAVHVQSTHPAPPIQPVAHGTTVPLSFAQQRLWFLYQLAPDNPFYNVPAAIRLRGTLDHAALERSFNEIVHRHAALRTTFITIDGQPVQVIAPEVRIALPGVDLRSLPTDEQERMTQQLATAEAQRSFNLSTDPLLRVTLLQLHPNESILLLTMHHIVADGWSLGVLIRELASLYTAFVEGRSPTLPALPIQYTDFSQWQREWLQGDVLETHLSYWRSQLQDLPVLNLPTDHPRPTVQTYRGATYPLHYSPVLTQALDALSQQEGVSLFMTLLAALQTLLYRYTGQDDIAIGAPIANRDRSELEGLIGFFVNSLVLRTDLSGNPTVRELLGRVREVALEAYKHQDVPFEKLVEELDPERDLSRNPLFQIALALQNAPMQVLELPRVTLEPVHLEAGTTRFDLEVHLWEPSHGLCSLWQSQEGLSGFVSYSTDLFDRDTIGRFVEHLQTLLEGMVANPDTRLSDLLLLTPTERQQILIEWNQTNTDPSRDRCFHHLFEAQAQQFPDAIAVQDCSNVLASEQETLTYGELNQRADHLAQILRQMGVQPDSLVGLCVDRSLSMVIGILGILKAGGAYVPLDPNYPRDRRQFMQADTQISILLTQSWLVETLPPSPAQLLCLDQPLQKVLTDSVANTEITPDHLAYVIYTSGSTGTPKGVLLSHRGLCNVVEAQRQVFQLSRDSRILQFSSLSFDASIFEIALAFGSGGTLYIPPKSAQLPGMALVQFLQDNAITHALLTPAVLNVLPFAELPALQMLITGGEACSSQVVDRWAVTRRFFNAYGPTETTIWATVAELHPGDPPLVIGRPVANTQVYILDAALNPVPVGIPGELYISGAGLARGYLNRPELTAERFISNPFVGNGEYKVENETSFSILNSQFSIPYSHLYKTGDRARYCADGAIEFLGRVDTQIKIRGFRVELGEIEATLQRHPAIQDAVTIASSEASDDVRLIAYFSLNRQHFQHANVEQRLQMQQIQHWQTLYNQTYQPTHVSSSNENHSFSSSHSPFPAPHSPFATPRFNITGWNSSYTGQPIPVEQMQEWVSDRVRQILALKPQRVLEIGCGTGLLLFQIAPHCQEYWGTDFSAGSLDSIQQQLDNCNLPHVKLLHRMATNFEGIGSGAFDVVILNSVVQYFPSQDYLMQVLDGAIEAIALGGVLFLGDVRSLPLLTAFHTWVQFSQAEPGMERAQLRQQVERSRFEEPELAIAPAFFNALRNRFSRIRQVQIRLPRGRNQNEMTQFRYNVLLHIANDLTYDSKPQLTSLTSIQWHDWKHEQVTVADVQKQLVETKPEIFGITNIVNSRVNAAVKTADWLFNQGSPKTVGRMREVLQNSAETTVPLRWCCAIDPQDWWDLETVLPYRVEIGWSTQTQTGAYDVVLIRQGVEATVDLPIVQHQGTYQSWSRYTNDPLQSQFARQLIPELRQYLGQTLPDYMVPFAFVPLEILPLTPSGKIDRASVTEQYRRVLPLLEAGSTHSLAAIAVPNSHTESTLADIWKELLRLKQLTAHDNFFELGGHSLLATQMASRVRDAFGIEMPLKSVFEAPTIAQLAPVIETLRETTLTPQVLPFVRLDRAAHRRLRSSLANANSQPAHELSSSVLSHAPTIAQPLPQPDQQVEKSHEPITAGWSPLVPLTLAANKQPFFCVHPMFGVVFPYLELAHHLENGANQFPLRGNRSFYGLQPLGLDGKHPPFKQIEAMASYYIQAIQTVQPHGPYFLGGWSFGGLVAFEMAQQLTQAGQQVALLAILDTPAPVSNNQPSLCQSLKFLLGTALWSALPFLLDYGTIATNRSQPLNRCQPQQANGNNRQRWETWFSRWQWSAVPSQLRRALIANLIPEESRLRLLDESAIVPMLRIFYANSQATFRYGPQNYSGQLTLFKAAEQPDYIKQDSTLGWSQLANDIQLHQVPGNHLSMLKQPHVQTLAQQLQQCLLL